jgi:hypothetical protein
VAPGGAFVALAVDLEGHRVARWLQERGIAAFVLKYRLVEKRGDGIPSLEWTRLQIRHRRWIRHRAGAQPGGRVASRCAPDGILGFSAGGMVPWAPRYEDAMARPSFAAMIYGGPFGGMRRFRLLSAAVRVAQDDPWLACRWPGSTGADARWTPELHLFGRGGLASACGRKHQRSMARGIPIVLQSADRAAAMTATERWPDGTVGRPSRILEEAGWSVCGRSPREPCRRKAMALPIHPTGSGSRSSAFGPTCNIWDLWTTTDGIESWWGPRLSCCGALLELARRHASMR